MAKQTSRKDAVEPETTYVCPVCGVPCSLNEGGGLSPHGAFVSVGKEGQRIPGIEECVGIGLAPVQIQRLDCSACGVEYGEFPDLVSGANFVACRAGKDDTMIYCGTCALGFFATFLFERESALNFVASRIRFLDEWQQAQRSE